MSRRLSPWCAVVAAGVGLAACSEATDTAPVDPEIAEARSDLARDTDPAVPDAEYSALIADNNGFAFDLYRELATDQENLFFSPLSVSVALAMTYAGARGSTETEMAGALHYGLPQAELHAAMNRLTLELDTRNIAPHDTDEGEKSVRLSLVNAAWAQQGYAFVPQYLDTLAVNYGAGVKLLDFTGDPAGATVVINDWVAQQTEDKIQNLIPDGAIDSLTRLVLTNTLYFYANWATVFDVEETRDQVFHAPGGDVTVPTMHSCLTAAYAEGDGWQLADLPYDGRKLAMTIVLPEAGRFDEVRAALTADWLAQNTAAMGDEMVEVSLPRFRFSWGSTSLVPALQALGMVQAFEPTQADFSGMTTEEPVYIGDVVHKAFVGVDESGTEAAAATAVIMQGLSAAPVELSVDRPFVFFIRDMTDTVLFMGQVTSPDAS